MLDILGAVKAIQAQLLLLFVVVQTAELSWGRSTSRLACVPTASFFPSEAT